MKLHCVLVLTFLTSARGSQDCDLSCCPKGDLPKEANPASEHCAENGGQLTNILTLMQDLKQVTENMVAQVNAMSRKMQNLELQLEALEDRNIDLASNVLLLMGDVDECSTGTHDCHSSSTCSNTAGSFMCICEKGYTSDGVRCFETNECTLGVHACDGNAECINTDGSYRCRCKRGFTGNGFVCEDINECEADATLCAPEVTCVNTPGSYRCACHDCTDPLCPPPFFRIRGECFHIIRDLNAWHGAAEECSRVGRKYGISSRVTLAAPSDFVALQSTIQSLSKDELWLGGRYESFTRDWRWLSGTKVEDGATALLFNRRRTGAQFCLTCSGLRCPSAHLCYDFKMALCEVQGEGEEEEEEEENRLGGG